MRLRVTNRKRWTWTKTAAAFLLWFAGIVAIGGFNERDPFPVTWPVGLLAAAVAGVLLWTCRSADYND